MYWTDAGMNPRIEVSWMDGSHRKVVISDRLGYPSGITVDVLGQSRVYWSDTQLNLIESCKPDGSDRHVMGAGELLHPFALDLFEDQLYWATRDTGEIYRQDKFGRGVKVRMRRSYATDVKVYQKHRYNDSLISPCTRAHCSHLCLLTPGGYRCACPDIPSGQTPILGAPCRQVAFEAQRDLPTRCHCRNGGACAQEQGRLVCRCPVNFEGNRCDEYVARRHIGYPSGSFITQLMAPLLLLLIAFILASGLVVYCRKRNVKPGFHAGSVLFRQREHVQFAGNQFSEHGVSN